jgi:hypothetical protein
MASGNDSQGLKIAVAIFVSLTVILAVATYFMYSEYSKASEQLVAAKSEAQQKTQVASQALTDFRTLRDRAGYADKSEPKAVQDEIAKDQQALVDKMNAVEAEMGQLVAKAQQAGASAAEIETFRSNLEQIRQRFQDESTQSPTFRASLDTAIDLAANQARLTTALAVDNMALRQRLAAIDSVNKAELDVQTGAVQKATGDLQGQIAKYDQIYQDQRVELDQLQTERATLIAQVDNLTTQIEQEKAQYQDTRTKLLAELQSWRTRAEQKENVLDVKDGSILNVDNSQRQVLTDVNRGMGARPQMILSVFDRDATGLPSDKPKARVKLIQVGEKQSLAVIEEQFDPRNPLRAGDQLYSAAWSPNEPILFALIGKIDINRDSRDDRNDLKALIRAAGGAVEYDLPPPGEGPETGELTARTSWYIVDDREPIRRTTDSARKNDFGFAEDLATFNVKQTEAIQKARELGVRPMPLTRLLPSLGYSFGMTIPGGIEARNDRAINEILNPGGSRVPAPEPAPAGEQP